MESSIFLEKERPPESTEIKKQLGRSFELWKEVEKIVMERYQAGVQEWKYSGAKYGWSFRIKDKKRVIVYFIPHDKYFELAFVFGKKATEQVLAAKVSPDIKKDLREAREYVEGRGIRVPIKAKKTLSDVAVLVEIKLAN